MFAKPSVAYYGFDALQSGAGGGGTDIFCLSLQSFLEAQCGRADLMVVPISPAEPSVSNRWARRGRFLARLIRDYIDWYKVQADIHILVYPKLPVAAFTDMPLLLHATRWLWQCWSRRVHRRGQRIAVIVEDLPAEQGFSVSVPEAAVAASPANRLEHVVFGAADLLVVPSGRMAEYIQHKHVLRAGKISIFSRNIYMPPATAQVPCPVSMGAGVNVLYSGSLDQRMGPVFRQVLAIVGRYPAADLWVCGPGRDYVSAWISEARVPNAHHLGILDHAAHDALARCCDFGLLLYPRSFYNDITPIMKYTAYAANGLAILGTDLATVKDNIDEDGIGRALSLSDLYGELECWLDQPSVFSQYKRQAEHLAPAFRRGVYMQEWFDGMLSDTSSRRQLR